MIKKRLGLDKSKTKSKLNDKSQTIDNSCGSLGRSTERDLIGNLLTPDEQSNDSKDGEILSHDVNQISTLKPYSLFSEPRKVKLEVKKTSHL